MQHWRNHCTGCQNVLKICSEAWHGCIQRLKSRSYYTTSLHFAINSTLDVFLGTRFIESWSRLYQLLLPLATLLSLRRSNRCSKFVMAVVRQSPIWTHRRRPLVPCTVRGCADPLLSAGFYCKTWSDKSEKLRAKDSWWCSLCSVFCFRRTEDSRAYYVGASIYLRSRSRNRTSSYVISGNRSLIFRVFWSVTDR
jgi:hypothetical protein